MTLTGNIGVDANAIGKVATGGAFVYSVGPSISWAMLDFSRIHARIDQAGAQRDEAIARYQGTVHRRVE